MVVLSTQRGCVKFGCKTPQFGTAAAGRDCISREVQHRTVFLNRTERGLKRIKKTGSGLCHLCRNWILSKAD
ncbi:hypothetical protein MATL_G00086560 [Megalops atlanticus]|uniref:Uncharacterized protein n=1 Tax=Megalops atlanticus TaxID=7932 RepID=A0A9D3Q7D7_MEGAT|nr:hypothetical protein MATL_G00086560 [Megalops atlanticus]